MLLFVVATQSVALAQGQCTITSATPCGGAPGFRADINWESFVRNVTFTFNGSVSFTVAPSIETVSDRRALIHLPWSPAMAGRSILLIVRFESHDNLVPFDEWRDREYSFVINFKPHATVQGSIAMPPESVLRQDVSYPFGLQVASSNDVQSYNWYVDNTLRGQGGPNVDLSFSSVGNHTVTCKPVNSCGQESTTSSLSTNVTVSCAPEGFSIQGDRFVCPEKAAIFQVESDQSALSYAWKRDGISMPGITTVGLNTTIPGKYEVTATFAGGCVGNAIHTVQAGAPPTSPVTEVRGANLGFNGEPMLLEAVGGADASSFHWEVKQGPKSGVFTTYKSDYTERRTLFIPLDPGDEYIATVAPVLNTCKGPTYEFPLTVKSGAAKYQDSVVMVNADLATKPTAYLYLPKHNPLYSACLGTLGPVTLNVTLDLGKYYSFGKNLFQADVTLQITAYSDVPGQTIPWKVPLHIDQNAPEQLFSKRITVDPALVRFFKIEILDYKAPVAAAANLIRLRAKYEEENIVDVSRVTLNPFTTTQTIGKWEQTFRWLTSCVNVPDYVFQIFKHYGNTTPSLTSEETWKNALLIQTERADPFITLSIAEGSGTYYWRVIPLGNAKDGIANPLNWGRPFYPPQPLTFVHPEENKNWIYSRTFAEGNKITEGVTYANGLNQVGQGLMRLRLPDANKIIATQTIQDYAGRDAISGLPVPLPDVTSLNYVQNLLQNASTSTPYRPSDFDGLETPKPVADRGGYYSGVTANSDKNGNAGVASAGGYPFSQTVFVSDATGRIAEQTGIGYTHSKAGGRTIRSFYTRPSEGELVSLFGKEAPVPESVQKVTVYDANNTATVSYATKDGNVIATGLMMTGSTDPFSQLANPVPNLRDYFETVRNNVRVNDHMVVSRTPLFLTQDGTVTVNYEITHGQLEELCHGSMNDLIGYYPFEGNMRDLSPYENHATNVAATAAADAFGRTSAYNLRGANAQIQIADGPNVDFEDRDFTVAFWIRKTNDITTGWIHTPGVNKWNSMTAPGTNEWGLMLRSGEDGNKPGFFIESGTNMYHVDAKTSLLAGQWYHLAGVRQGDQLKIYVNGELEFTRAIPAHTKINNLGLPVYIGRFGSTYTAGTFDDVQLYKRALTDGEISQLRDRGTACVTCDYRLTFKLLEDGKTTATDPIPTDLIPAGECAKQKLYSRSFNIPLKGGKNYTLEKYLTLNNKSEQVPDRTFLDSTTTAIEQAYRNKIKARLNQMHDYIDAEDFDQLYTYLVSIGGTLDNAAQQYIVPLLPASEAGCQQFIMIPRIAPCVEEETPNANCKIVRGSEEIGFERYFEDYYAGRTDVPLRTADGKLSYVYFVNQYPGAVVKEQHFAPGQLDAMVANMRRDNPQLGTVPEHPTQRLDAVSCKNVWEAWKLEVAAYESKLHMPTPTNVPPELAAVNTKVGTLESFLNTLEGTMQSLLTEEDADLCVGDGRPAFIRKQTLYGEFTAGQPTQAASGTDAPTADAVNPDLTLAYRLVYYKSDVLQMRAAFQFYAGIAVGTNPPDPTIMDFVGATMGDCGRYWLSKTTNNGAGVFTDLSEKAIQKNLDNIRNRCDVSCDSRRDEFLQAIINSLFNDNPNTKIQYYTVREDDIYKDPTKPRSYIGKLDMSQNVTGYTVSKCELDAMTNTLVAHCKNNYCHTPLTPHEEPIKPNSPTTVRVYGTPAELLKIEQALTFKFDVKIGASAANCGIGWDVIPARVSDGDNFMPIRTVFGHRGSGDAWRKDTNGGANPTDAIYLPGAFQPITYEGGLISQPGSMNYAAIRINIDGSLGWVRWRSINSYGGVGGEFETVNIDNQGNVYVVGAPNNERPANEFYTFMYVTKYTPSGNTVWSKHISEWGLKTIDGFSISPDGIVFAAGKKNEEILYPNYVVKKIDTDGNLIPSFELILGSSISLKAKTFTIVADAQGHIYVTYTSPTKPFFDAYNSAGVLQWRSNTLTTVVNDAEFAVDSKGNIFHFGWDGVIRKISPEGTTLWEKSHPPVSSITGNVLLDEVQQKLTYFAGYGNLVTDVAVHMQTGELISSKTIRLTRFGGYYLERKIGIEDPYILFQSSDPAYMTSHPGLVYYDINNVIFGKYTAESCGTPAMCFQFTESKVQEVVVPTDLKDIVYNPAVVKCEDVSANVLRTTIDQQVEQQLAARLVDFRKQYYNTCGDPALIDDELTIQRREGPYQFTLYYYDRSGNLVRTVPPAGVVRLLVGTEAQLNSAKQATTQHTMVTEYQYNTAGQMIREHTPDANYGYDYSSGTALPGFTKPAAEDDHSLDASRFYKTSIYSDKGMIRFARNAQQKIDGTYSYIKYDALGRVIESGEGTEFDETAMMASRNQIGPDSYPVSAVQFVTRTIYTDLYPEKSQPCDVSPYPKNTLPCGYGQDKNNLRNRISYRYTDKDGKDDSNPSDRTYTVYNYDVHGNVDWLVQMIPGMPAIGVRYTYDLLTGIVTHLRYNPKQSDQFYHRYVYDDNNRLARVLTSKDSLLWETESSYSYYLHGPLKRMTLGKDLLQGVDYTYTIQGWLKGVNHGLLDITSDPGRDGSAGKLVARDAFGMGIGYYQDDYSYEGSPFQSTAAGNQSPASGKSLYNGNIASWSSNILYPANSATQYALLTGNQYSYDVLNRLMSSVTQVYSPSTKAFSNAPNGYFNASYQYDANGNITSANHNRGNETPIFIDRLTYNPFPVSGTNRLDYITETADENTADGDIEPGQPLNNYQYDAIGNLVRDIQQGTAVTWNSSGKVDRVNRVVEEGNYETRFLYDASGNRVVKTNTNPKGLSATSYYVRDGHGAILATYESIAQAGQRAEILMTEVPLQGSSRLGTYIRPTSIGTLNPTATPVDPDEIRVKTNTIKNEYESTSYLVDEGIKLKLGSGFVYTSESDAHQFTVRMAAARSIQANTDIYTRFLNSRRYELNDHLGNVRTVITDVKLSTVGSNGPQDFIPEVVATYNYYPFGMAMPGRVWESHAKYKYGFNGKEKDQDGEWGSTNYDYGFRIYNPGIGRFLSIDPLTSQFAELTPYQFSSNKPIVSIDLDGLEARTSIQGEFVNGHWTMGSDNHISLAHEAEVKQQAQQAEAAKPLVPRADYGGTLRGTDITSTPEYKFRKQLVDDYADVVVPYGLMKKYAQHEEITAVDVGIEVVGVIPIGKIGRLLKYSDKVADLLKTVKKLNPCGCFDANTLILADSGLIAIDKIKVGDQVWAWNGKNNRKALKKVIDVFSYDRDTLYHITIGEENIDVTSDHPIYSGHGWKKVSAIAIGDSVHTFFGKWEIVNTIDFSAGHYRVYNFTVEDFHTYYVTESRLLVHNGTCDVTFGANMMTKFRKHAAEIIAAARKQGITLPSGVGKETTQQAFQDYIKTAVKNGDSYVAEYMTLGDVIWTKYGDSIILRHKSGEFITHLTAATKLGQETMKYWNDVVSKSVKAVPLTTP